MYSGEGEQEEVPPMHVEIEVEMETDHVPQEVARQRCNFQRPLCPFETAVGFGNWLSETLSPSAFQVVYLKFMRYCIKFQIKKLVRFGARKFVGIRRLFFLEGVYMVAVTELQKEYVRKICDMYEQRMEQQQEAQQ